MITIAMNHELTKDRIEDLICGAIEGGCNYWARFKKGEGYSKDKTYLENIESNSIIVEDVEEGEECEPLSMANIEKGFNIMAEKYPWHMKNFIEENDDAETSDVLMQCAVLGDIVFG